MGNSGPKKFPAFFLQFFSKHLLNIVRYYTRFNEINKQMHKMPSLDFSVLQLNED